jgi:hypothetical protein
MNKLTWLVAAASLAACAKKGMTPEVRNEISAKLATTQNFRTGSCGSSRRSVTSENVPSGWIAACATTMPCSLRFTVSWRW